MSLLGAINKLTKKYVYPVIANKKNKYMCPDCNKTLIFCHGKIIKPYFRHKADTSSCTYYDKPSESQIHKDAKMLLKKLLETQDLIFKKKCSECNVHKEHKIKKIKKSHIELEYRFEYDGKKIADVARVKDGEIKYIFEIYHTHKTDEKNRPEPWFEINALKLIEAANSDTDIEIIKCLRNNICKKCKRQKSKHKSDCKHCRGTGKNFDDNNNCDACYGTGKYNNCNHCGGYGYFLGDKCWFC